MKIEHINTLTAGLVEATLTQIEEVSNDFGESIVFYFTAVDKTGNQIENMRLYCSAIISGRSKLGKLCKSLGLENVEKVKDSKDLQKLIGKKTALKAFENDAGYMRLKLVD